MSTLPSSVFGCGFSAEFDSDLGDRRRTARLQEVGMAIAKEADCSFLETFQREAEREAFYRLIRSSSTKLSTVSAAHRERSCARAESFDEVLVVHDTTEFRFPVHDDYVRTSLHRFSKFKQGFRAHASLLVSADGRRLPLGVVGMRGFVPQSADPEIAEYWDETFGPLPKLTDRWFDSVKDAEEALNGRTSAIHVADREADFYSLLRLMHENEYRFVIRARFDRFVKQSSATEDPVCQKVDEALANAEFVGARTASLGARARGQRPPDSVKRNPPRRARRTKFHFRFIEAEIPVPTKKLRVGKNRPASLEGLPATIIEAVELHPPDGEIPVRWVLLTSERVETLDDVLRVVDIYRSRWIIEEYFKAIKTGCAFQKRQMSSADTLLTVLGILLPIAWRLLLLRYLDREEPKESADFVLSVHELKVLRARVPEAKLPKRPSIKQVTAAIARLGGHVRSNGPPGWQVLGRGFEKLLVLTEGYRLALAEM